MKKILTILLILAFLAAAGWFFGGKAFFQKKMQGQMMQKLQTVQRTLDKNSDGIIGSEEIKMASATLATLDKDGNGNLSRKEMGDAGPIKGSIRNFAITRLVDTNGDLSASAEEIKNAATSISRLDLNKDGQIDATELIYPRKPGQAPLNIPMSVRKKLLIYPEKNEGPILPGADDRQAAGKLFIQFSNTNSDVQVNNRTVLLDENGTIAHEWTTDLDAPEGVSSYLLPNGNVMRTQSGGDWMRHKNYPVGATGIVQIINPASEVLWQFEYDEIGKHCLHHDQAMLPNGNILLLVYEGFTQAEASALGWKKPNDKFKFKHVFFEKIIEVQPFLDKDSTAIVWEWSSANHIVQDEDANAANYGKINENTDRLDVNYPFKGVFLKNQKFHFNSIDYNTEFDQILLSSAMYGELYVIDHSTTTDEAKTANGGKYGKGGRFLYRYGNQRATKTGEQTTFYWQHDVSWLPKDIPHKGDILVFNNGAGRGADGSYDPKQPPLAIGTAYTDILELKLPRNQDGSFDSTKAPETVWSYNSKNTEGVYAPFMSGARRLKNGNTIFCQGHNKRVIEITPEGEKVMDFQLGGPGNLFRVYKYDNEYSGIVALQD